MTVGLPLEDIRILAVEQYGAGPFGSLQLADLGADVIKVEDPAAGGDVGRYVPPFAAGEDSLFFETFNRGKRSIDLDLRSPAGREVLVELSESVDALYCNLRGDLPERLGLTYEALGARNPRIVCCSLSGYGMTGPRRTMGAYDYVIQGLAGWMSVTGEPAQPPQKSGLSLVDFATGYVAAIGLLAGVWRARRDGVGGNCDVSLHETALALLTYVGTWAATEGYRPARTESSAHPSIVPFQNFATSDGWIVVACPKEKYWRALCQALGLERLLDDERFASFGARYEHRDALLPILRDEFRARSTSEWIATLAPTGIPCGPVNDIESALEDEQAIARNVVAGYDHPVFGNVRYIASPFQFSPGARAPTRGPRRGEHTESALRDLCGYSDDELRDLRSAGAFG